MTPRYDTRCIYILIGKIKWILTKYETWFDFFLALFMSGYKWDKSSNVNEVMRAVLNSLLFLRKDFTHKKKHKNGNKRTKIKKPAFYTHKKHLREKKSFIRLFAFLCFLCFCAFAWLSLCAFCAFRSVASLYFLCFLYFCLVTSLCLCRWNLFVKKIKRFKTALIT